MFQLCRAELAQESSDPHVISTTKPFARLFFARPPARVGEKFESRKVFLSFYFCSVSIVVDFRGRKKSQVEGRRERSHVTWQSLTVFVDY